MGRRLLCFVLTLSLLTGGAGASDLIRWVDFDVSLAAMERALALDIESQEQEVPLSWIDLLALAATHCGGKNLTVKAVNRAREELLDDRGLEEQLGKQYPYFDYYRRAYTAALGGLVGNYAIEICDENGERTWKPTYGLKAFSPIAAGYAYSHYDDFGASRSYGFRRKHLGHDMMGSLGTPIVAVEAGIVEAAGWNRYGGWRIGIRSFDRQRYYYYAHLRKDKPFAPGIEVGATVQAGDVIGFMGRTGYSDRENVNNIETVHLHFGLELIFDESQKECDNEIWIDVYQIVRLLERHRSTVQYDEKSGTWKRVYAYRDLDTEQAP